MNKLMLVMIFMKKQVLKYGLLDVVIFVFWLEIDVIYR